MYKQSKMRSILFLILSGIAAGMASCEWPANKLHDSVVVDEQEQRIDTANETVLDTATAFSCPNRILEVTTSRAGTSPFGRVLDFRILRDGRYEFDHYFANVNNSPVARATSQISEQKVMEIEELLSSVNEETAGTTEFPGDYFCCDVYMETRITFCSDSKEKIITINEFDTVFHPERKNRLPVSLTLLVAAVGELRSEGGSN